MPTESVPLIGILPILPTISFLPFLTSLFSISLLELVTQDKKALVNVISGDAHDLQDGATVKFSGVEGMEEINGREGVVTVVSPYSFTVDIDTSGFSAYKDRGRITEIKKKKTFEFESLADSWSEYKDSKTSTMDFMKDMTVKPVFYLYYQVRFFFFSLYFFLSFFLFS